MALSLFSIGCLGALMLAVSAVPVLGQTDEVPAGDPARPAEALAAADQTEVPVKLVVLYSSGVGYFEHHGTVEGNASTEIRFKTEQINDLLKSLVLQDLDNGQVTAITYPSLDPLGKLLKSFQVDVSNNLSRSELLKQLRGAKVRCELIDGREVVGTVVGVEVEKIPSGEKGDLQEIDVLNLLTDSGMTAVRLPSVRFVTFEDKRLQQELNKALGALAQARDKDKKPVTINFVGDGQRRVKIGYVIETPVWKTSYRLLLGEKDSSFIQGWAIIENQTDTDWNDVQLSLVSGRPISFVQDLYQPLYIPRPEVQPELYASLRPRQYEAGMSSWAGIADAPMAPATPAAPQNEARAARSRTVRNDLAGKALAFESAEREALDASGVVSAASATNLGELFQYTVGVPVTLSRQKSAMLPIIADEIEARRVSIYNAATLARHPLNGAILKNTTGKHLLNGPITVIENGAYGGDARISDLPPGQNRLISYGIDLKVLMDSTSHKQEESILTGKIVKGTLHIARKYVFSQEYKAENKGDADKTLIIEHPFRKNWKLVAPERAMETTDELYRFELVAPAGKQASLVVQEERTAWEAMAILPLDLEQVNWYSRSGQIPQKVRDALVRAAQLKQAVVEAQRRMEQTRRRLSDAQTNLANVRENIKALGAQAMNMEFYQHQVKRMQTIDEQVTTLMQEIDNLQQEINTRQKALEDYLNNLDVE